MDHIISATLKVNRNYTQMPFLYLIKVFNNWTLSQVPLTNTYMKTRHRNLKTIFILGGRKEKTEPYIHKCLSFEVLPETTRCTGKNNKASIQSFLEI